MAVSVGTRLGPYEILAAIGAGGMGEVYRARDTKLNRDVAIKPALERTHDITRDGKQFIGVVGAGSNTASGASAAPRFQVVLNWFEELKARVPTK